MDIRQNQEEIPVSSQAFNGVFLVISFYISEKTLNFVLGCVNIKPCLEFFVLLLNFVGAMQQAHMKMEL